jgi:DNA-binding CsgD family transcriptional regulator
MSVHLDGRRVSRPGPGKTVARNHLGLTEREMDVLTLRCAGRTFAQIGVRLGISAQTVKNHSAAILRAFGHRRLCGVCFELGREIGRKEGTG